MNETLELIDGLRSLELEEAFASATDGVHESLVSELQDLSRLIQCHWTQHVEPIRGQQSHTRDVLLVLMGLGQVVHEARLEGVPIDQAVASCGTEPVDCGGRSG